MCAVADLGGGGGGGGGVGSVDPPFSPSFGRRSAHTRLTKLMQLQHQNLPGI